jgi:hypothetical protein
MSERTASASAGGSERPVCGPCRRVVLATVVGGEHRPKPIGGAWAQGFEDPSTRLVYLIRPALEPSIPAPLLGVLRELSEVCLDMALKAADVVESHGEVGVAAEADRRDEVVRSERSLFARLLPLSAGIDVDAAIDLTLAARTYQRCAEHAVAVAHRAALLAVGAPRN